MRHFQDSKLTLGAVVLAASLVATGCGSADDVARAYSSELAEAIAEAGSKMKNPVSWLKSGKTAASQTDDLSKKLATSPSGLTDQSRKLPELVAEIRRGQSVQTAIREVDATAVVASDIGASLSSDAIQSAGAPPSGVLAMKKRRLRSASNS